MKIQSKGLELMAIYMGEQATGPELVQFLQEHGVSPEIIVYPNTKWRMLHDVMCKLSSSTNSEDHTVLSKIITSFLHPLNLGGDETKTLAAINQFNHWLKYDNLELNFDYREVHLGPPRSLQQKKDDDDLYVYEVESATGEAIHLIKTKYLSDLVLLKKCYQLLINIVDTTLESPSNPDEKLNEAYLKLCRISENAVGKISRALEDAWLGMAEIGSSGIFYKPFKNLYSVEAENLNEFTRPNSIEIKAKMNAYLGEILELCLSCNAGDVLDESKIQKLFNEISLYLTQLKEKKLKPHLTTPVRNIGSPNLPWPKDYHWDEKDEQFVVSLGKGLVFESVESDRKIIFRLLAGNGGEWVEIKSILPKLKNKDENTFRSVIGALKEKIAVQKLSKYIAIEGRGDINKDSAYRVYVPEDDVI